ncbi:hypothetical protein L195_g033991, partial [Trifolium pratense]
ANDSINGAEEVNGAEGDEKLKEVNVDEAIDSINEAKEANVDETDETNDSINEAKEANVAVGDDVVNETDNVINEGDNVSETDNENEDESSEDSDYLPSYLSYLSEDDESFMDVESDLNEIEIDEPGSSRKRGRQNEGIRISIDLDQNVEEEVADDNYSYHSEEPKTPVSSEDEADSNGRQIFPQFDANAQFGQIHLEKEMEFETLEQFKKAVRDYTIYHAREIKWIKNDKVRCRAVCKAEDCGWQILCSWSKLTNSFQVKTFAPIHNCCRGFVNSQAKTTSNRGTTAKINVTPVLEGPPQFKRFYVCLDASKRGFKAGCRPFIGLDGCFLTGYYGGQLLTAVGTDANNQNFVIVYDIVDAENKDNWKWFLTLLHEDLGDYR